MMENFKVTLELETPFILDRYTTLDSMLIAEYFKLVRNKGKHMEFTDDLSMIDFIDRKEDILSGSIWYVPKDNPLKLDFTSFYKKPETKKIFDLTSKHAKKPASEKFLKNYTGAFALSEEIVATPQIYFYIRAKKKQLVRLLQQISGIGKKRNIGFGKVSGFIIETKNDDKSFALNGSTPSKPLPVKDFSIDSKKIAFYRAVPPYWSNKNLTACYMPSTSLIEYTDKSSKNKNFKTMNDLKFESGLGYISRSIAGKYGLKEVNQITVKGDKRKARWKVMDNKETQYKCCLTDEVDDAGVYGASSYIQIKAEQFPSPYLMNETQFISKTALWGMSMPVITITGDSLLQNGEIKKLTQKGAEEGFRFKDYIKNPYMLKPPFVLMRKVSASKPEHVALGSRKAISNALYPIQYADKTYYVDSELLLEAINDVRNIIADKVITKSHLLGLWRDYKHPELGRSDTHENRLIIQEFQKKYDKAIRMSLFSVIDFS